MDLMKNEQTVINAGKKEILFHGIPASPGIAIAPVYLSGPQEKHTVAVENTQIDPESADSEIELFKQSLERTRNEIKDLQSTLRDSLEERDAAIFDAHLLIVDDRMLSTEVVNLIRKKLLPARSAFRQTIERYISAMSSMPDQYLRERAADIQDVANRILANLDGLTDRKNVASFTGPVIVIAKDLTPSDTATLDRSHVIGFAIETGSPTSHTAILARSMKIPAVVGMRRIFERLTNGDKVIIDGYLGMVIIHPEPETIEFYEEKLRRQERLLAELEKENRMLAETTDGYVIQLMANVEGIEGIEEVKKSCSEGIGLFRTEYLFMNKPVLPDEETQFQVYKKLAELMPDQSVIIRTLDVGGDKFDAAISLPKEPNPFLGMRAIRLGLSRPELLKNQLRALLRAGVYGDIKILFPMISSLEELEGLLHLLEQLKDDLRERGIPFKDNIQVGVMIEIPSAVLIADQLAKKADFFSIGSNDLVQYTLAVDRSNEKVAKLYNPMHPAVIELIAMAAKAARDNQIWISCCGELAGDPLFTPLLVGLGVQELSMSPGALPAVRRTIRRLSMAEAEALVQDIRQAADSNYTATRCKDLIARIAPSIAKMNKGF